MQFLKEGHIIKCEDDIGIERLLYRQYELFNFTLVLEELSPETISQGLEGKVISKVKAFFDYFNFLTVFDNSGEVFLSNGEGIENEIRNYFQEILFPFLESGDYELEIGFQTGLKYLNNENNISELDSDFSFSILNNYRNGIYRLSVGFIWGFGAEWFYNEFAEENKKILRDAFIGFYESNPGHKDLDIEFRLFKFDLDLKSSKPIKVKKNMG